MNSLKYQRRQSPIFNPAQEKAMKKEIRRQCAEYNRAHKNEIVALVLWEIHEQLGLGAVRLRRFFDNFDQTLDAMLDHYEMSDEDTCWICTQKLKDIGIDIEAWQDEGAINQ